MLRALLFSLIVLSLGFAGALSPPVHAATTCIGVLENQTVLGDLVVPLPGCSISNVTVKGNVIVQPGALFDSFGSDIFGNFLGSTGAAVGVFNGRVRGDVAGVAEQADAEADREDRSGRLRVAQLPSAARHRAGG